jgi:8-oxo-dGTP pyrophosphatase MutT (NUDIX family)
VGLREDGGSAGIRTRRDGGVGGRILLPEELPGEEEHIRTSLEDAGGGTRSEVETGIDLPARQWTRHIEPYRAALSAWLAADAYLLDTSTLTPYETALRIAEAVRSGAAPVCDIVQTPQPTAETLASGVLLFDDEDRVMLVDPTYKPGWEFPGGVVEPGEAPARAGIREVAEETGIRLATVPRLLVIDWERPAPPAYGGLRLLFDGGRLQPDAARDVLLPGTELRDWRFVTEQEAAHLLPPVRFERLRWALRARERGAVLYLEGGVPV